MNSWSENSPSYRQVYPQGKSKSLKQNINYPKGKIDFIFLNLCSINAVSVSWSYDVQDNQESGVLLYRSNTLSSHISQINL
jgi:hypothetical protein